jgi:PhzF family phenazine biosynthesis protein
VASALPIYQVDAFTHQPFRGNPAGVCITDQPLSQALMQQIAAELNLSETAFAVPEGAEGSYHLRWFTPVCEVKLCGHATLATAKVLFESTALSQVRFRTLSGELQVVRQGDQLTMALPVDSPEPVPHPIGLNEALGAQTISELRLGRDSRKLLVRLDNPAELVPLRPNFGLLAELERRLELNGFIATCEGAGETHFMSRFFGPGVGINEDPVTGSAHTLLAPYWSRKLGLRRMHAYQASPRGGWLDVELFDDRVELTGSAVIVMESRLFTNGT